MRTNELYGFRTTNVDDVSQRLTSYLQVVFQAHDSVYRGGKYLEGENASGHYFRVQKNFGELGNEWAEEAFSEYPVLVYVSIETASPDLEAILSCGNVGGKLLRRQTEPL